MRFAVAFELLADSFNGLKCLTFFGLAWILGGRGQLSLDHHRAVRELLFRGCGPNRISFLKAHHFDQKFATARLEAEIQRGVTFTRDFVLRLDARLKQAISKAQLKELRLVLAFQTA